MVLDTVELDKERSAAAFVPAIAISPVGEVIEISPLTSEAIEEPA